jgi:hypothetical protein
VILLDASTNVMRDRLKERATVSRRIDDNAVQVEERLTHYQTTCQAVIDYYRPHKKLHVVRKKNFSDEKKNSQTKGLDFYTRWRPTTTQTKSTRTWLRSSSYGLEQNSPEKRKIRKIRNFSMAEEEEKTIVFFFPSFFCSFCHSVDSHQSYSVF